MARPVPSRRRVIGEVAGPAILAGEASLTGAALAVVTLEGIGGPLGSAAVGGDGGVSVEYERFTRRGRPQSLTVAVPAALAPGGRLQVRISAPFLERVERLELSPPPVPSNRRGGPPGRGLAAGVSLSEQAP